MVTKGRIGCPNGGSIHSEYIICIGPNKFQCMLDSETFNHIVPESDKFGTGMDNRKSLSVDTAAKLVEKDFE